MQTVGLVSGAKDSFEVSQRFLMMSDDLLNYSTSTIINSMEVALWLQSAADKKPSLWLWTYKPFSRNDTSTRIILIVALWLLWTYKPLVQVSVKVTCQSTTATYRIHGTTSMLLVMVEVSVKTGLSVYDSDRHRTTSMLRIMVEVSLKMAC